MGEGINPIQHLYTEFDRIISSIVIKYSFKAEEAETLESKSNGDGYLDAYFARDNFSSYEYTKADLAEVILDDGRHLFASAYRNGRFSNIKDDAIADIYLADNYLNIPQDVKEKLLVLKRQKKLDDYCELNDYYRMLNGQPPYSRDSSEFAYPPERYQERYDLYYPMDGTMYLNSTGRKPIPIHDIERVKGVDYIEILRGLGVIDDLRNEFPDDDYLNFLGKNRIPIYTSRSAKNFEIIQMDELNIRVSVLDEFKRIYDQSRRYFVSTIYVPYYRSFISYYDYFIGLCIMVMTIQQVVMHQMPRAIDREFFDINGVQLLYEAYNVPYNLGIDDYTQKNIVQYLNMLIQNKATNKVIFDICALLGYSNVDLYKYYLARVRKFDNYGLPIVAHKEIFNNDTGEVEDVYDHEKMYDVYFHKVNVRDRDYSETLTDPTKRVTYESLTENDPYWYEDTGLQESVWDTEYNFIESKYLGLGLSYSMTEIMFENIILFKLLMDTKSDLSSIKFTVPKIAPGIEITMFDAIIMLCCLMCKKHKIGGEIITVPTQVISVLDFLKNRDAVTNETVDTLQFNFKYFEDCVEDRRYLNTQRIIEILDPVRDQLFDKYTNSNIDSAGERITPEYIARLVYIYIDKYGFDYPYLESMIRANVFADYSVPAEQADMIINLFGVDAFDKYGDRERTTLMSQDLREILKKELSNESEKIEEIIDSVIFTYVMTYIGNSRRGASEQMTYESLHQNVKSVLEESRYDLEKDTIDAVLELITPEYMKTYDLIDRLSNALDEDEATELKTYVSALTLPEGSNKTKIEALNKMFKNIKNLSRFINKKLSDTQDRKTYNMLKQLYRTSFYSKELKDIFTINTNDEKAKRCAYDYFEYLYHECPTLYSALFTTNMKVQYQEYKEKITSQHNIIADEYNEYKNSYPTTMKLSDWIELYFRTSYDMFIDNLTSDDIAAIKVRHPNIKNITDVIGVGYFANDSTFYTYNEDGSGYTHYNADHSKIEDVVDPNDIETKIQDGTLQEREYIISRGEYTYSLYTEDLLEFKIDFQDQVFENRSDEGYRIVQSSPYKLKDWLITYKRWSFYTYYNKVFNTDEWLSPDVNTIPVQTPDNYIIDCFECDVERGYLRIRYDTMLDEGTDSSNMETKIYYYSNHLIGRLEEYIDDLKFVYLTNDTSTPLSDLLIKLIRFFKSFTVDMLNMDVIFVFDLKEENMVKFFDEVAYITKKVEMDDHIHVTYSDVIHCIQVLQLGVGGDGQFDKFSMKDRSILTAIYNSKDPLILNDIIRTKKLTEVKSDKILYDSISSMAYNHVLSKDSTSFKLKDRIYEKFYTDPEST